MSLEIISFSKMNEPPVKVYRKLYEVERITKMKEKNGRRLFRIKWVGYPSCQNTWEPQQHVSASLINSFIEMQKTKAKTKAIAKEKRQKKIPFLTNSQQMPNIKILSMNKSEGTFHILRGNREEEVPRQMLFDDHSELLARFYLREYLKQ